MEENTHANSQQEQHASSPPCRQANRIRVHCPACGKQMSTKRLRYTHVCATPREVKTPEDYMEAAKNSFERRSITVNTLRAQQKHRREWSNFSMFSK